MPANEKARVQFISYVTNEKKELLHTMEYSDRQYLRADTLGKQIVHYYVEQNQIKRFYTDPQGVIHQEVKVDLATFALQGGFRYSDPVLFSYWKTAYDKRNGIGTSWKLQVDTTFAAVDSLGRIHALRFTASGKARLAGWTKLTVPAERTKSLDVVQVKWAEFENKLYDITRDEWVWRQQGKADDFFEPKYGLVRNMADYILQPGKKPEITRSSTYELYLMILPE
jgi:hypothetical protein